MELKKNDLIELSVTGMTAEGMGVGHYGGWRFLCLSPRREIRHR